MVRPLKLDDQQRRTFCALVSVGLSQRKAARHLGFSSGAIRHLAGRDPQFAEMLRSATTNCELSHLQNIRDAGKRSWRASAWFLERVHHHDYAPRRPQTFTVDDIRTFLEALGSIIATAIPTDDVRRDVLSRIKQLFYTQKRALRRGTKPRRK
jgi:hypothetical protein